ncbi:MAG: hypothetical protein HY848_13380 [Betaproteobacteria bacterium]|nr:hypothetical protein [Betaproteobacteria bacterium]
MADLGPSGMDRDTKPGAPRAATWLLTVAKLTLAVLVFLLEVVAVHERAWPSVALFGTALVSLLFPRSLLPTWSRGRWIALGVSSFVLAIVFLPESFIK